MNINVIICRIKSELNLKTDKELARLFNIAPHTLSYYKTSNNVPYAKIIKLSQMNGLDLNYIFLGYKKIVGRRL